MPAHDDCGVDGGGRVKTDFVESQYDLAYPAGIENHWWHLTRNKIVLEVVRKHTRSGSIILDVGCGRGIVVEYLRGRGLQCDGVEPGQPKPLAAVEDYVHTGAGATDLPLQERARYDTLLLLDVIEHLPDEVGFLRSLMDTFINLSSVIVTVPARPELWSQWDVSYGHYRRYTPEMIVALATAMNWNLVFQSYFFRCLYLPARLLRNRRSDAVSVPRGLVRVAHRVIASTMLVDFHALPVGLPGTSIVACFRLRRA